jgi:uncharacterized protein (TIGR02996 family)
VHVRAIEANLDRRAQDPTERDLVDAIAEHPRDEEPYLVYADYLLQRGHPRGEYIALVCQKQRSGLSAASARRLAALESTPYLYGVLDDLATS